MSRVIVIQFMTLDGVVEKEVAEKEVADLLGKRGLETPLPCGPELGAAERLRFHDLRHTCDTFLQALGVPPRVVMDILGHNPNMLFRRSCRLEEYSVPRYGGFGR